MQLHSFTFPAGMSHTWKTLISRDRVVSGDPRPPWSPSSARFRRFTDNDFPSDGPFRYTHLNDAALHFSFPILCFYLPAIVVADLSSWTRRRAALIYSRNVSPCVLRVDRNSASNGAGCISTLRRFALSDLCYKIFFFEENRDFASVVKRSMS